MSAIMRQGTIRGWICGWAVGSLAWFCGWSAVATAQAPNVTQLSEARKRLVDEIIVGGGVRNERVLQAMRTTLRHEFVAASLRGQAYFDMSLPIGSQQTISSPFIVAYMTEALDPQPTDKVLEIGTGSGYQAAVLSPIVKEVYSIEIVPELGQTAARTLKRLGYVNVFTKVGDGFQGWAEHAPFDKIIVTCSPEKVPLPLAEQLREGGLMVVPVGERYQQTLYLLRKKDGKLQSEALVPTLFVPMTGAAEVARQVQPDPLRPTVVNGDFEQPAVNGQVPGWYYHRGATHERDPAPGRGHVVTFSNQTPGSFTHLLQGFAVDGRKIGLLEVSAMVRAKGSAVGRSADELPCVAVTFYDETRKIVTTATLGAELGTYPWRARSKRISVPPTAREGILRIGLFGGVGDIAFDDLTMKGIAR